jgi:hypothetical protein
MPLASTTDLVLAGITNIQQALLKAAPALHPPPNHVSTLKQLIKVLMSVTITDNEHTPSPKTDIPLGVDSLDPIAPSIEVDVPPLRVVTPSFVLPSPVIVSPKIHFAPSPLETMQPTYHTSKGIQGAQHCCTQHNIPLQPFSTSATSHPRQTM